METFAYQLEADLFLEVLVEADGLDGDLADVVVLQRKGNVVFARRAVETEDPQVLGGCRLPLPDEVEGLLLRGGIVLLCTDPERHVAVVRGDEEALAVPLDYRDVHDS